MLSPWPEGSEHPLVTEWHRFHGTEDTSKVRRRASEYAPTGTTLPIKVYRRAAWDRMPLHTCALALLSFSVGLLVT